MLAFDPHPQGCPIGLAVTPAEMTDLVSKIYVQLSDLLHFSVHVINPRRGDSYPLLNLYEDESATTPRMVCFPGWESNAATAKRRIGYARQTTLIQRIHDAGVEGEDLEQYRGTGGHRTTQPLHLFLGYPAGEVGHLLSELDAKLGDLLRITVTTLNEPAASGGPLMALRLYATVDEERPRVVLWPGWRGGAEAAATRLSESDRDMLWTRILNGEGKEVPLEMLTLS